MKSRQSLHTQYDSDESGGGQGRLFAASPRDKYEHIGGKQTRENGAKGKEQKAQLRVQRSNGAQESEHSKCPVWKPADRTKEATLHCV